MLNKSVSKHCDINPSECIKNFLYEFQYHFSHKLTFDMS